MTNYEKTKNSWRGMIERCKGSYKKAKKNYKDKGITYISSWGIFSNFLTDMGYRPENTSLERKNNNFGYSKENCEWATIKVQNNNSAHVLRITFENITKTIEQWINFLGIVDEEKFRYRLTHHGYGNKNSWTFVEAATNKRK